MHTLRAEGHSTEYLRNKPLNQLETGRGGLLVSIRAAGAWWGTALCCNTAVTCLAPCLGNDTVSGWGLAHLQRVVAGLVSRGVLGFTVSKGGVRHRLQVTKKYISLRRLINSQERKSQ